MAGPQTEKEAAQMLGELHGDVTPLRVGSGALLAVLPKLKFPLCHSGG